MKQIETKARSRGRSPGRKEKRRRAIKALAAAGAIAGGTQAYAAPVRFDNPPGGGHFAWPSEDGGAATIQFLDLTADATSQPPIGAAHTGTTIAHIPDFYGSVSAPTGGGIVEIQVGGTLAYPVDLLGVDAGTAIPTPGAVWSGTSYGTYLSYPGYESAIPDGATTYLGFRFNGPEYQNAWIKVERTGDSLDALAWGYETEPGVPIAAGAAGAGGDPTGACCGVGGSCEEITEADCEAMGWTYIGDGMTCEEAACAKIPTVSQWGLAIMSLNLLVAGTWVVRKRMPQAGPPVA